MDYPDILLVTLDTTRADAMGAYGHVPSPTPHFDRVATEGYLATEAMAVSPLTLPSHASIMTGLYPTSHGVRDNGYVLSAEHTTLAELLKQSGYSTQAVVSSVVLDAQFGLGQGFDTYVDGFDMGAAATMKGVLLTHPAEWVANKAISLVADAPARQPMFIWTHFYDAHLPLQPISPFKEAYPNDPYFAEIMRVDEGWGRIASVMAEKRRRPQWLIVLADHGEGRGDHGETSHGLFVYRSTMHIPFAMMGWPQRHLRPRAKTVSQVDILPTIIGAISPDMHVASDGVDLLQSSDFVAERLVYGETIHPRLHFGMAELRVLQGPEYRYIQAPESELFAYRSDNKEVRNLWSMTDERIQADWVARMSIWNDKTPRFDSEMTTSDTRAALETLGYMTAPVQWQVHRTDGLPDPKTAPDIVHQFERVRDLARSQNPSEGARILEAFLADYPRVVAARLLLSEAYRLSGRTREAHQVLTPILKTAPKDANFWIRAGELLMDDAQFDAAKIHLDQALQLNPKASGAKAVLGELYRRTGSCDAARDIVASCIAGPDEDSRCLLVLAACHQSEGRWAESIPALERAALRDAHNADTSFLLAMALIQTNDLDLAVTWFKRTIQLDSNHREARIALGMTYYQLGQFVESVETLSVYEVSSMTLEPLIALSDAALHLTQQSVSIEQALLRAQVLAPDDPRVYRLLSKWSMKRGNVEDAVKYMNQARGISP